MTSKAPLREVVERIGRHAVRLTCGHVVPLFGGEPEAVGKPDTSRAEIAGLGAS